MNTTVIESALQILLHRRNAHCAYRAIVRELIHIDLAWLRAGRAS